jgi:plasmid stability protein
MASITIRDIDERLKARLRVQAAHHGRSMEEEARDILRTALSTGRSRKGSLVDSIRARIEPLGGHGRFRESTGKSTRYQHAIFAFWLDFGFARAQADSDAAGYSNNGGLGYIQVQQFGCADRF